MTIATTHVDNFLTEFSGTKQNSAAGSVVAICRRSLRVRAYWISFLMYIYRVEATFQQVSVSMPNIGTTTSPIMRGDRRSREREMLYDKRI